MTEGGEAAVKKIEELAVDVRAQYPMFHKAEQARREAFESLSRLNENGDWRDNLYEQLGVHERQRLLSVENFVGLEFLESGRDTARNLRLMGNFYASKYVYERRTNPTDLDRAQYYLELALTRTGRAFRQLNDYGALHLVFMQPAKLDIAESQFMESREKWKHQRAAYNLASIALDRGNGASARPEKVKHYSKAHSLLKEALGNDVWELTKSIEREGSIHYNLACCLARLSECDESVDATKRLAETLAELEAAARAGVPKLDVFTDDLNVDDGDLGALSRCADPIIRSELSRIRSLLGEI
jgi:tetratricopeptide (TPR) repeat protein